MGVSVILIRNTEFIIESIEIDKSKVKNDKLNKENSKFQFVKH